MAAPLAAEVVLVTGGGSGIGRAVCELAAGRGAAVAAVDLDASAAAATVASLPGGRHASRGADVTDPSALADAVEAVSDAVGPPTRLVACAGVTARVPLARLSPEELRRVFDVNVFGTVYACQAVVPAMRRAGEGAIAIVSSVAAQTGGGFLGGAHYAASKAALVGLARGLARELAPAGIRVNAVAPGPAETPLLEDASATARRSFARATLLRRIADPSEVAAAIVFAVGPDASYMTGETINVNGGAHFA